MIIAVDFDGTCVKNAFPLVGEDIGAIPVLREIQNNFHRIILWTCRSGIYLPDASKWFADNGIALYGINCNRGQRSWSVSPKVFAHTYIDDASLGTPLIFPSEGKPYVDWQAIRKLLLLREIIKEKPCALTE